MGVHLIGRGRLVMLRLGARVAAILCVAVLFVATPALAIGSFSPSVFKFVTSRNDDGEGKGGGWQETSAQLNFSDARPPVIRSWSCRVQVGMPLRTDSLNQISPESAAEMTADIATEASWQVMHQMPEWLTAAFCLAFKNEMNRLFKRDYLRLGARVNSP